MITLLILSLYFMAFKLMFVMIGLVIRICFYLSPIGIALMLPRKISPGYGI